MEEKCPGCANHNRLDLIRHTEKFTAAACGSIDPSTGKPDYCCFECVTLKQQNQQK